MAKLEILNQYQIDSLIDSSEFNIDNFEGNIVGSVYKKYADGYKNYDYSILKICTFAEAQNIIKKLIRLWCMKDFIFSCWCIISWIEKDISLTISVNIVFID